MNSTFEAVLIWKFDIVPSMSALQVKAKPIVGQHSIDNCLPPLDLTIHTGEL